MVNSAQEVAKQKATLRTLKDARSAKTVRINPLKVVAEQQVPLDIHRGSSMAALQAAQLIAQGGNMTAKAIGTGSGYSYNKGYYGNFEEAVINYDDILGGSTPETEESREESAYVENQVVLNSDAPKPSPAATEERSLPRHEEQPESQEEGGIKAIWSKYKTYIIILAIAVAAFGAYKKL